MSTICIVYIPAIEKFSTGAKMLVNQFKHDDNIP